MADDVQVPGELANRIERACQEELRQEDEREDEVGRTLIWEEAHEQSAERCAEDGDEDQRGDQRKHLCEGEWDAEHDAEEHHRERLWEGNERFTEDFPGEDRASSDRGDEDLLAEIVLSVFKDGDQPECCGLPDALGQLSGEDEREQVDPRGFKVGGKCAAEDANEERREDESANKPDRITE